MFEQVLVSVNKFDQVWSCPSKLEISWLFKSETIIGFKDGYPWIQWWPEFWIDQVLLKIISIGNDDVE